MRLPYLLTCTAWLCLGMTQALAQTPTTAVDLTQPLLASARLEPLDRFAQTLTTDRGYLGAVTLVARNGQIIDWRAHGSRDLARTSPMKIDSIFRIYSMTKTIVSVAVLMLVEDGKLALDDPIANYMPEFSAMQVFIGGNADAPELRPARQPIRVRHLLTHTGGFATSGMAGDEAVKLFNRVDLHASPTLKDYASAVAKLPLAMEPGERFNYDGVGLELLSRLIELRSGMPMDIFLQQRLLTPLGMKDTGFGVEATKRDRIADMVTTDAQGHLLLDSGPSAKQPGAWLNPYPSGAGGLYSTAADYLRFCQMLLNGGSLDGRTILSPGSVDLMQTNQLGSAAIPAGALRPGDGFGFGGYVVLKSVPGSRPGSIGQFGWSGAGSTYYTIDRQEKLVALLLMQHLPQNLPKDPPKVSGEFFGLVYQSLVK